MSYDGYTIGDYTVDTSYDHTATSVDMASILSTIYSSLRTNVKSVINNSAPVGRVFSPQRGGVGVYSVDTNSVDGIGSLITSQLEAYTTSLSVLGQYAVSVGSLLQAEGSSHDQRSRVISSNNSVVHSVAFGDRSSVTKEDMGTDQNAWEAAENLLDRNLDVTLQDDEQAHKTLESGYSRTQQTTIQDDRQSWETAQSLLDRSSESSLQDAQQAHLTSEKAYERSAKTTLSNDQNSWLAAEGVLDRALAVTLQDDEQSHRTTENGYIRTQKTTIQNDRQSFEAAQSVLDRSSETTLQDNEQAHKTSEAAYARSARSTLASDQFSWEAAQSVLDRALASSLQDDEQSHKSSEAVLARAQKQSISSDQYAWDLAEAQLDSTNKETMLLKQLRLDFLVVLVAQTANETIPLRLRSKTYDILSYATYDWADPITQTYLQDNKIPLLWNADCTLSKPAIGAWFDTTPLTQPTDNILGRFNETYAFTSIINSGSPDIRWWDEITEL